MNTIEFKLKALRLDDRKVTILVSEIVSWSDERGYTEVHLRTGKSYSVDDHYIDATRKINEARESTSGITELRQ